MGGQIQVSPVAFSTAAMMASRRPRNSHLPFLHTMTHLTTAVTSTDSITGVITEGNPSPYQLFCPGNFFGEYELLHSLKARSRLTGVRCEADGCVLVLAKADLYELMAEFPIIGRSWRNAAVQREYHRQRLLRRLVKDTDFRGLAASMIQRYVRTKIIGCSNTQPETPKVVAHHTIHENNQAHQPWLHSGDLRAAVTQLQAETRAMHWMLRNIHQKLCAKPSEI